MPDISPSSAGRAAGTDALALDDGHPPAREPRCPSDPERTRRGCASDIVRQPYWAPAPATLWCSHGDVTFLLSLDTGRYHALDDVASAAWREMCEGEALEAIARRIAAGYGGSVDAGEVLADLGELFGDLSRRGLIVPLASPPASTVHAIEPAREERPHADSRTSSSHVGDSAAAALPSVFACLVRLAIVHVLMKRIGLRRLLRRVARSRSGPLRVPASSFVTALAHRVGTAMVWYPFGAACLEHSVCLLWMMRRAGCEVQLRIGVQPFPFSAHAWVECQGEPINESAERVALFKPFPVITLDLL